MANTKKTPSGEKNAPSRPAGKAAAQAAKASASANAPGLRQTVNPAASWPFPTEPRS